MGFHGSQPGFNAGHPQTSPQLGGGAAGGGGGGGSGMHMAKWHIPQSAQSNCECFMLLTQLLIPNLFFFFLLLFLLLFRLLPARSQFNEVCQWPSN